MKKSEFERLVDKAFWELETRHGLKRTETKFHKHGCNVRFQNATTLVILNYDITSLPWLEIADIQQPDQNKSTLEWLLVEMGVEDSPTPEQAFHPTKMHESELEAVLQTKCQQLLQYGTSLLNGDFSILPKLQERAKKYALACERYAKIHKTKK
jgi:hypothetical protein